MDKQPKLLDLSEFGGAPTLDLSEFQEAPTPPSGLIRRAADYGVSAIKSAIAVPEAAVGLGDIVSGGHIGKLAEQAGFRPKEANAMLDTWYSPEQQLANKKVQQAEGFVDTAKAAIENPSTIAHSVVQSLGLMGAGGVIGRGAMALAPKLGGTAAAAIGEGAMGAGMTAEQIRQENPDGTITPKQAVISGLSGAATGLIARLGGAAANKMGIGDVDTMLVKGSTTTAARAAGQAAPGVFSRAGRGFISEGLLEELPQSISEQMLQNEAQNKPLMDNVGNNAAMGLLSGGVMGAGGGIISHQASAQPGSVPPVAPAVAPTGTPTPPPSAPLTPSQEQALRDTAAQRLATLTTVATGQPERVVTDAQGQPVVQPAIAPEPLSPTQQAEHEFLQAHKDDPQALAQVYPVPPETPADLAGIDPALGPISQAAAIAVNQSIAPIASPDQTIQAAIDQYYAETAQLRAQAAAEQAIPEQANGTEPDISTLPGRFDSTGAIEPAPGVAPGVGTDTGTADSAFFHGSETNQPDAATLPVADAAANALTPPTIALPKYVQAMGQADRALFQVDQVTAKAASSALPVTISETSADPMAAPFTPELAMMQLHRAGQGVTDQDGKLRSNNKTGATVGQLLDSWVLQNQTQNAITQSRQADPAMWAAYDARQQAVSALEPGDSVLLPSNNPENPQGVPATLARKFKANWRVTEPDGTAHMVPPAVLRPTIPLSINQVPGAPGVTQTPQTQQATQEGQTQPPAAAAVAPPETRNLLDLTPEQKAQSDKELADHNAKLGQLVVRDGKVYQVRESTRLSAMDKPSTYEAYIGDAGSGAANSAIEKAKKEGKPVTQVAPTPEEAKQAEREKVLAERKALKDSAATPESISAIQAKTKIPEQLIEEGKASVPAHMVERLTKLTPKERAKERTQSEDIVKGDTERINALRATGSAAMSDHDFNTAYGTAGEPTQSVIASYKFFEQRLRGHAAILAALDKLEVPRKGEVGMKLTSDEVVTTSSGRQTSPFPAVKTGSDRAAKATTKAVDRWLIQNALAEAQARSDDFNATQFKAVNQLNVQQADKDAAEQYLFGEQPAVVPGILKPLVAPRSPEADHQAAKADVAARRAAQAKAAEADQRKSRAAARETERSLFSDLSQDTALVGKTLDEVRSALDAKIAALPEGATLPAMQAGWLARAIHKSLATQAKELEKQKHRDPALLAAAIAQGQLDHGKANGATAEDVGNFSAGFMHALAGKTKSTLSGEGLAAMLAGYESAQAWIKTEVGEAWFEGKPQAKLHNTGVDLRRHWEQMQAQMKADETDVQKAWAQIDRATTRASLFDPLLPEGVSPGFRLYVTEVRGNVMPFKEWLDGSHDDWYGSAKSRYSRVKKSNIEYILDGSRYPSKLSKEDRAKWESDSAYRINYLQDAARTYLEKVKGFIDFMDGTSSVKEAALRFDERYVDPTVVIDKSKGWFDPTKVINVAGKLMKSRYDGGFFSGSATDFIKLRSTSDWTEYLIEKEATIALPKRSDPLTPPKLDRVTREGLTDYRKGESVTPTQVKAEFGFADVGFGGYVKSKQDQDHLNYAADAFRDLAKHFGTDAKNIGFGGQLHFTIGALGHGKFSAHFSPNQPGPNGPVQVINLTNTRGDGTVYHEWTHALDHFLGGEWKGGVRKKLLAILQHQLLTPEWIEGKARSFLFSGSYWRNDKKMDRVDAAVRAMEYYNQSYTHQSAYKTNADKLGKDYWGNEQELIARASEAWAADTLNGTNSYLVNADWVGDGKVTQEKGYRGTPYPTGDERALFIKAYTALAKSVKWIDGKPTVTLADFNANLPEEFKTGEMRRKELQNRDAMVALRDKIQQEIEDKAAAREQTEQDAKAMEQAEMDRLVAQKLAELAAEKTPAIVDGPKPDQAQGPLSETELSDLFDQAAAEMREEQAEKPEVAPPGNPELDAEQSDAPSESDRLELAELVRSGQQVVFGGSRWAERNGLPTIHSFGALPGNVKHVGFGVFEYEGPDFRASWTAGGAMSQTTGGTPYTTMSVERGTYEYPKARVLEALTKQSLNQPGATTATPTTPNLPGVTQKLPQISQPQTTLATDATAAELIHKAAQLGVTGANEALKGLSALFGKPGTLRAFPGGIDADTYASAKPHFQAALKAFQEAGKTLKDLFKMLIGQFGDGIKPYAIEFAREQGLGSSLAPATEPAQAVASEVEQRLARGLDFGWRELFLWADKAYGGTQGEGKYTPKDAYDAMEMGMNRYLMTDQGRAFNPQVDREAALMTVAALERATALLPTQTKRTDEQNEFQQFSTVPALAFVANWVANISNADVMLEPSAGLGGLAVFAKNAGAQLVLNELSSRRAALLQQVFPASKVYTENAEQIHNILPDSVKPSVVVMNPPFSASAGRMQGARDTKIGAQHVEQALLRLEDGGRLVAIVGEGMAMDRPAFKDWWSKISSKYDVRAAIPVDGKGYAKYGTAFDNVLLVIDKRAPLANSQAVTTKVSAYSELIGLLSEIQNDRVQHNPASESEQAERDAAESARSGAVPEGKTNPAGGPDSGQPDGVGKGQQPNGNDRPTATRPHGGRGGGGGGSGRGGSVRQPGPAGVDANNQPGAGGDTRTDQRDGLHPEPKSGLSVTSSTQENSAVPLGNSIFENYQPQRLKIEGAKPHPGPLVQSAAMASVLPPAPTYTPNLPIEVITEGKLSLAQLEAVVYAGQAHQEMLPRDAKGVEYRKGFFIGDGTGVGKGREIGGIILDNRRQARTKAVWFSEKPGLIVDAKRDYAAVGGNPADVFPKTAKAEGDITAQSGILFTSYATLRAGAQSQATSKGARAKATERLHRAWAMNDNLIKGDRVKVVFGFSGADSVQQYDAIIDYVYPKRPGLIGRYDLIVQGGQKDGRRIDDIGLDEEATAELHGLPALPAEKAKKTAGQSRVEQLVKWLGADFDGVIAFDESHNGANAEATKGDRGTTKPSQQALAMLDLQNRLPKARVLYVSATGATQVANLAYASRLGLWGAGTPFPSVSSFIAKMTAGGLATMELVARDMKQMGVYMARSLSYDGVTYGRVEHELTPIQHDIYNRLADAWQVVLQNFDAALHTTGAVDHHGKGAAKGRMRATFWGAQLRFFNQIITSMQMPSVIEQAEKDIADGKAVIFQLVNTNEAQQERSLADRVAEGNESLEDLDLTPRKQLTELVKKSFPVLQYQTVYDANGNPTQELVRDSEGKTVENKEAVAEREKLLKDLEQITVPDGPLEIILNAFGVDQVAEVTGRTQRIVNKPDQHGQIVAQKETRGPSATRADADAFMADKKRILVFSDAGGTGYTFSADLTKANQRKRHHYLLQPGYRADKVVQGFGRSHRTNQKQPPHLVLASANIPSQKRFLSAIARRLDMLGAMTKGQRDTANQGLFSEKDNLESKYATQAVRQFIDDMQSGGVNEITFSDYLHQTGLEDIVNPITGQIAESKYPSTQQFLNRMLSLRLDMQDKVFEAFASRLEEKIAVAIARNEFDSGMQTIRAMESKIVNDEVVYTDEHTGATTRYVDLELTQPTPMHTFPAVEIGAKWLTNSKSGRVWVQIAAGQTTLKSGAVVDRFRMYSTGGLSYKTSDDFIKIGGIDPYKTITRSEAEALWAQENAKRPATFTQNVSMVVGAMLPIWDRLETSGTIQVARTQTTTGERLLGMVVNPKDAADLRKRLNVNSAASKLAIPDIMGRILKGEVAELANGWHLERARVSADLRIELKTRGYLGAAASLELKSLGIIREQIQWNDRYFVPTGKDGVATLERLLKSKPIVDLIDPNAAAEPDAGSVSFSRAKAQSSVLSANGKFNAWPKSNGWNRAEYNDVVSLLPADYRNDPRRQQPIAPKDWDAFTASVIPDLDALNRKVGPRTEVGYSGLEVFKLDNLGNINVDARFGMPMHHMDAAIELADKHGLGMFIFGVSPNVTQGLMNLGFAPESEVTGMLLKATDSTQFPIPPTNSIYGQRRFGSIMSRKPRGFPSILFSRDTVGQGSQSTQAVQKTANAIASRWANAPKIVVATDLQDPRIPERIRQEDSKQRSGGAKGAPEGFYYKGTVYLMAGQLATSKDTARVLFHETLGHYGLRGVFGEHLNPILGQIARFRPKEIGEKLAEYGLANTPENRLKAAEEVLANMAQTTPTLGFVKQAIAAIRSWLRTHIPMLADMALTDDEIVRNFIAPARAFAEQGAAAAKAATPDSLGFSRGEGNHRIMAAAAEGWEYIPAEVRYFDGGQRRAGKWGPENLLDISKRVTPTTAPNSDGAAMFSRSVTQVMNEGLNNVRELQLPFGYVANDFLKSSGKLSWWHKSFGTMFNLAQRSPEFKRVFDGIQTFLSDVSYYANEAANLAPNLMPQLNGLRDLAKMPISAGDNKAVSNAVFQGTLNWGRDASGRAVPMSELRAHAATLTSVQKGAILLRKDRITEGVLKMWQGLPLEQYEALINGKYEREMLKEGARFTPAELKSIFSMTDPQVGFYNEFRAATDKSITDMAIADMLRLGGKDTEVMREQALASSDVMQAAELLRDQLLELAELIPERANGLIETANTVIKKADLAHDLMKRGYAPLMRFGNHTLDVVSPTGERLWFGLYESSAEANKFARKLAALHPDARVTQGTLNDEAYKMFAGTSPETQEIFGQMLGLDSEGTEASHQAFQEYIKLAKNNRSTMKRLIERKGIAGFHEDAGRVLAAFVYSNARATSSTLHMQAVTQSVLDIPKEKGDLQKAATRLYEYVLNPQEEAQAIRGMLFAQYLGGSMASALVNMTQPVNVSFPWLSQYGGVRKAAKQMLLGMKDATKKSTGDAALDAALKKASEDGVVSPQDTFQMMAQGQGKSVLQSGDGTRTGDMAASFNNKLSKLAVGWGQVFSVAEQFNRRATFIAAYRTAVEQHIAEPAKFAEMAVQQTQFVYNKGCVDDQTECLTAAGWKFHKDLVPGESVYAVDSKTGMLVDSKLVDVHRYPGHVEVTNFNNSYGFSMVLSDEHTCLVQNYNSRDKKFQRVMKVKAKDVKIGHNFMRVPLGDATGRTAIYSDDEVRLFAWVAAEHTNCHIARGVNLSQSQRHNPHFVLEIDELLGRLGGHHCRNLMRDGEMVKWTLRKQLWSKIHKALPGKMLTFDLVNKLTVPQMGIFLDTFVKGDGHVPDEGGPVITQKNVGNLNALQAMAVLSGKSSTIYPRMGKHNFGVLSIAKTTKHTQRNALSADRITTNFVWCPQTEHGTWIARRKGRTFVTGNSKPAWARGAVGGVLFTFKSYSINYIELLSRMAASGPEGKKAALLAVAILFMMAGAGGLPFAEDIDDIVDGVMQSMGYNFSSRQAKHEFLTDVLGNAGAQLVMTGISGIPGMPVDTSGRFGMDNLIPGTGLLTRRADHTRDFTELLGPMGDFSKRAFDAAAKAIEGDILGRTGALATVAPTAVRNAIQALDMWDTGMYRDKTGKKVIDTTAAEGVAKFIGFQPNTVARQQEVSGRVMDMIAQNRLRETQIANLWAQGVFEENPDKVQKARDQLVKWNQNNPMAPIRINYMSQILPRVRSMREDRPTRIAKTAPKEIRAAVRQGLKQAEL